MPEPSSRRLDAAIARKPHAPEGLPQPDPSEFHHGLLRELTLRKILG